MLRKRDVSGLSPAQRANRIKNLDVLHRYLMAGVFPNNSRHQDRQPYFIDDNDVFCAAGYLMKESGAKMWQGILNAPRIIVISSISKHGKLMAWVEQSGLTLR